jgi:methylmalonyl-CoA mutase N-terminal domain/subunit
MAKTEAPHVKDWTSEYARWEQETYRPFVERAPERRERFVTVSGLPLKPIYAPPEGEGVGRLESLGFPGEYPYTRGVYPTMYRGRLWTRRQIAGFGTAPATNRRLQFLLRQGQTGLSVDFDHPTLTGYDSLDPLAEGEVGRLGVAIDTVRDMEDLLEGIPIDRLSTSFTINHPACVLLSMYLVVAEGRGLSRSALRGTVQNDALKEFYGQKTFALPPAPAVRLAIDVVEYCCREVPKWNAINVSGYHTREAGATAVQELAFTLGQGLAYAEALQQRGLDLNVALRNLSFFFGCHMDFFEEIAKFRAARRLWARLLRETFGVQAPEALRLRFHTQTLGSTLARHEPKNNIIRGALQALAAVLGGTQSLHVSGYDEAYDIPSEDAMRVAIRTQQIIAEESGVASVIDPLGGSYFLEELTDRLEAEAITYLDRIRDLGGGSYLRGMLAGIETGYIEREIVEAAVQYQRRLEQKDLIWVGENDRTDETSGLEDLELFQFDERYEEEQKARLWAFLAERNATRVKEALRDLREVVRSGGNTMPAILNAVRSGATEGEVMGLFREEFGTYVDPAVA